MDRTTSHAGHDESLIVRLYGGDVDGSERALALAQMADCGECADLFADLGAIAGATAAMPVPARPRDFTLTSADAARLRRERNGWRPAFLGAGLRRSLGGSLAALGLAGVLFTSAVSIFGGATATSLSATDERAGAPQAASSSGQGTDSLNLGGLTDGSPAPAQGPVAAGASLAGDTTNHGQTGKQASFQPSLGVPASVSDHNFGAGSPGPVAAADGGGTGNGTGFTSSPESGSPNRSGIDDRLIWLIGFGVMFGLGVAILLIPWVIRRRARGTRL